MKPRKVEVNAAQPGLNPAFASLDLPNLPAGPAETAPGTAAPAKAGRVVLRKETAHRGGKAVLVIGEFAAHFTPAQLDALAARLKAACGCGGTRRDREIELQGEAVGKVRALLEGEGFQVAGVR